jgi:phage gpG-like protein
MTFDVKLPNFSKLFARLEKIAPQKQTEAYDVIAEGTLAIHETAIKSIQEQGSSSGTETRYKPKRDVKVSAPGSPPNTDTGTLVKSIGFEIDKEKLKGRVGTNLKYGAWLEFGTSNIAARPWLRPAFMKHQKAIVEALKKALKTK